MMNRQTIDLDCPANTAQQLTGLVNRLLEQLANLAGIYLHGSLAMGCFNPQRSDLDVLVVTNHELAPDMPESLAKLLLDMSGKPHPIEISLLTQADLSPWRHPCPYQFHFSEDWRARFEAALRTGATLWGPGIHTDPDLAAHITITQHYGLCLYGLPISEVFPDVLPEDYQDSIQQDVREALANITHHPVYAILNSCRVLAYLQNGLVCSKAQGGLWALGQLPDYLQPAVQQALDIYSGKHHDSGFDAESLNRFVTHVASRLISR